MGVIWGLLLAFLSIAFSQDVIRFGAAVSLTGKFAKEGQLVNRATTFGRSA